MSTRRTLGTEAETASQREIGSSDFRHINIVKPSLLIAGRVCQPLQPGGRSRQQRSSPRSCRPLRRFDLQIHDAN